MSVQTGTTKRVAGVVILTVFYPAVVCAFSHCDREEPHQHTEIPVEALRITYTPTTNINNAPVQSLSIGS